MAAVVSVHVADVGVPAALRLLAKGVKADGLRHGDVGIAAPLGRSVLPRPTVGRVGFIGLWDSDDAVDAFVASHAVAERLAGGWHARLEPLRCFGSWPGLDADIPSARRTDHDGQAVVLTLGRLKFRRAVPFFRTSARAEGAVVGAPGLVWATGLAKPPFVATCSVWESTRALSTYAYGAGDPAHPDAIAADAAKPFHKRSAFVRFRPYRMEGGLDGRNPLLARAGQPPVSSASVADGPSL